MPELLQAVFSNVEDIYQFHCDFLKCLKKSVVEDQLEDSCVGHCFVENVRTNNAVKNTKNI